MYLRFPLHHLALVLVAVADDDDDDDDDDVAATMMVIEKDMLLGYKETRLALQLPSSYQFSRNR